MMVGGAYRTRLTHYKTISTKILWLVTEMFHLTDAIFVSLGFITWTLKITTLSSFYKFFGELF
jgi:hypothetical protein